MTKFRIYLQIIVICLINWQYYAFNRIPYTSLKLSPPQILSQTVTPLASLLHNSTANQRFGEVALTASVSSGSSTTANVASNDQLSYLQLMTAGAISRTLSQVLLHPAYTYKTLLQLRDKEQVSRIKLSLSRLLQGADAQFLLSLPHGALYFMVIDNVKAMLSRLIPKKFDFIADFSSSAISTIICSVISTPQMVITDRLMAGVYPTFPTAVNNILKKDGLMGFYRGWWPALAQKIPSYGLTWMFFQHLKRNYERILHKKPNHEANFILGALAAAASVTVMIPMDTIKTRLVIQTCEKTGYKGVTDCFIRIVKEEGFGSLYRSLPPRLLSVVPMIAIQYGIYELLRAQFIQHNIRQRISIANRSIRTGAMKAVKNTASRVNRIRKSQIR